MSAVEQHEWDRLAGWHLAFAVLAAAAAGLLLSGAGPAGSRGLALALVGAIVLAYVALGVRALRGGRGGPLYVAVAIVLVLTLFVVDPVAGGVLLFLLYPHIWRLLRTRDALVATVVTTAGVAAAQLVGADPADAPLVAAWMGAALLASVLTGLWITRVVAQSSRRADLLAELEAARAELDAANRDLGALAERERLAREIHDTLAQGFTSIVLLAQGLDPDDPAAARILSTARENLAESRALVAALAPAPLGDATLPAALRRLVERVGDELDVDAVMHLEGRERSLPAAHDVVLLRVSQEALTNVRKHAGATRIGLTLRYADDGVDLRIHDDGRGFDAARVRPGAFGLGGMRDRVREIGGVLEVTAAPDTGTCVEVRVGAPMPVGTRAPVGS